MHALYRLTRRISVAIADTVRWSMATVEDDTPRSVIPMPGPAHGPVRAIDLRIEERRRRQVS